MDDIPKEIEAKIKRMLQQSGKAKEFQEKVKIGMETAFHDIQAGKVSNLVQNPFNNANSSEIDALQCIFLYLSSKNLSYTLQTLLLESQIKENPSKKINLISIINYVTKTEADNENEINFDQDLQNSNVFVKASPPQKIQQNKIQKTTQNEVKTIPENQKTLPPNDDDSFVEFEELSGDYLQGEEITKEEFEQNEIIVNFSDL